MGAWNNQTARALVRFDLDDAIGQPAQVRHARLQMHDPSATGTPIGAHRLTAAWTRGQVSWTQAETGEAWETAGGDHDGDAVSVSDGTSSLGYRFEMPGLVQRWLDEAADNHGVLLRAVDESDPYVRFSTEASLLVEWTPLVGLHHHANIETQELDDRRGCTSMWCRAT